MLSYTESLIQSGKPVDEAIFEGYEKVLAEQRFSLCKNS